MAYKLKQSNQTTIDIEFYNYDVLPYIYFHSNTI